MNISQESFDNWLSMSVTQAFLNSIRLFKINSTMNRINESNKTVKDMDTGALAYLQGISATCDEFLGMDIKKINESIEDYPVMQKAAREYMKKEFGEVTPNLSIIKGV